MIETIFLQQHTTLKKPLLKKEKLNIILSPIFYWAKIFVIPVDSTKKALPLLANLFEDYFDTDGYSFYTVQLEENKYLAFAYDEFKIIHFLKEAKIPLKNVGNIYFAQNEFANLEEEIASPLRFGEDVFDYVEGILVKIPQNLTAQVEAKEILIEDIFLGEHCVQLDSYQNLNSNKPEFMASSILLGFSILLFLQIFLMNQQGETYPQKSETMKEQYKLPATLLETKALLEEYEKIDARYKKNRESLATLVQTATKESVLIEELNFEKDILKVSFDEKEGEKLIFELEKKFKNSTFRKELGMLNVRIKL